MKFSNIISILIFSILVSSMAFAACSINGKEVPCDSPEMQAFGVFMVAFFGIFGVVMLVALGFWVWMLVDIIKNEEENKLMWVVILALVGPLAALIYFVVRKLPRNQK